MSKIIKIDSKNQFDKIIKEDEKVFVDFKADWCGPCKMIHPFIEQLSTKRDDVTFLEVDVDQNRDLAQEYGIMSIPNMKVFKKGRITQEALGFTPINKLEEMLK